MLYFTYYITRVFDNRVLEESGLIQAKSIDHAFVLITSTKSEWQIRDIRVAKPEDILIYRYNRYRQSMDKSNKYVDDKLQIIPSVPADKPRSYWFLVLLAVCAIVFYILDSWRE